MEPVAGLKILLYPNGEMKVEMKGLTLDTFKTVMLHATLLAAPKLIEQDEARKGPQIQIPAPGLAAKLANGVRE